MFRALKGYDILLNYIEQNKRNFIFLMQTLSEEEAKWASLNPYSQAKR